MRPRSAPKAGEKKAGVKELAVVADVGPKAAAKHGSCKHTCVILWGYILHIVMYSVTAIVVFAVAIFLNWFAHLLVGKFLPDRVIAIGISHLEYTMFGLDAFFLVGAILIHTVKTLLIMRRTS